MRLLHIVHQYPPDHIGGTELYTQTLARAQAERGHRVAVFYPSLASVTSVRRDAGVELWPAPATSPDPTRRFLAGFRAEGLAQAFERALDAVQPDLVHVQHLLGLPAGCISAIRRRGIPFVITLHDYWWVCANAQLLTNYDGRLCSGPSFWYNCARCGLARGGAPGLWPAIPGMMGLMAWRGRMLHVALAQAARLIAPSPSVAAWYAGHGAAAARLRVVPHGIEMPLTAASSAANAGRPAQNLKDDDPDAAPGQGGDEHRLRVAAIGGLAWQKGIHVLIEAFGQVRGPAELLIAGDESFDPIYARRLHAAASPGVRFLGALSRAEVWRTLAQTDILAVPSLWPETFSLIAHEAFAGRVPVMASALGALADAVHDNVDGLLLPPGDGAAWRAALQALVDDPTPIERWRAAIRAPLSFEEHVDRIEAIYGEAGGCT